MRSAGDEEWKAEVRQLVPCWQTNGGSCQGRVGHAGARTSHQTEYVNPCMLQLRCMYSTATLFILRNLSFTLYPLSPSLPSPTALSSLFFSLFSPLPPLIPLVSFLPTWKNVLIALQASNKQRDAQGGAEGIAWSGPVSLVGPQKRGEQASCGQ